VTVARSVLTVYALSGHFGKIRKYFDHAKNSLNGVVRIQKETLEHHAVDDGWIQSLAYDRVTQCLEVRFKWHSVHQYRPVPLQVVREIWKARPMNTALQELVMKNRRIRFDEVRSEKKLLVSLLRGWAMIPRS
jgi:hypothetical protein